VLFIYKVLARVRQAVRFALGWWDTIRLHAMPEENKPYILGGNPKTDEWLSVEGRVNRQKADLDKVGDCWIIRGQPGEYKYQDPDAAAWLAYMWGWAYYRTSQDGHRTITVEPQPAHGEWFATLLIHGERRNHWSSQELGKAKLHFLRIIYSETEYDDAGLRSIAEENWKEEKLTGAQ
jgi:hypothetical protein